MQRRWFAALAVVIGLVIAFLLRGNDRPKAPPTQAAVAKRVADRPHRPPPASRAITGVVLLDGKPVSGATVRLRDALALADVSVVTGADGRFALPAQRVAAYEIAAEKAQLVPAIVRIDLRDPTAHADDIELVMHACTAMIYGTVRDASSGPVPHARLALTGTIVAKSGGTEADEAGAYELCVPVGDSTIVVGAAGYARTIEKVEAYGRVQRDFALVPEATLAGRVLRADDRTPVAAALVEAQPDANMPHAIALQAITDAEGNFAIDGALPGQYAVRARAEGLTSLRPVYAVAEAGETEALVVLVGASRMISGKVTERDAPVAGVTVWFQARASTAAEPAARTTAITQQDGTYALEVAPDAYVAIIPERKLTAMFPPTVTVTTADVTLDIEVEATGAVTGHITHEGKAVEGAVVMTHGKSVRTTTSDREGNYAIAGLQEGPYTVYAESERVGAFATSDAFSLAAGQRRGVDVEMDLAGAVAGIVVDQHDTPVPGVAVNLSRRGDGEDYGNATTAADGTFEARGLAGGGEYAIRVLAHERSVELVAAVGRRHPPVAVRDGKTRVTGVRLKVHRELFTISGRVLDARGAPVVGARLELEPAIGIPSALTDETGAFTVRELPATTFEVAASHAGRRASVDDIQAGATHVIIKFADVGSISGTLVGFAEPPEVLAVDDGGTTHHATVIDNAFRIRDLLPGEYHVSASSLNGSDVVQSTVAVNVATSVTLRARAFGAITGMVRGGPAVGACTTQLFEYGHSDLRSERTTVLSGGRFRFDRAVAGTNVVTCEGARGRVVVNADAVVDLELVPPAGAPKLPPRGDLGFALDDLRDHLVVSVVRPSGPAARAGIAIGDILVMVDGDRITDPEGLRMHSWRPVGSQLTITLERDGQQRDVELTIGPAP